MKKDEMIERLLSLVNSLRAEKDTLLRQVESLTAQLAAVTEELASLRKLLEGKAEQEERLRAAKKAIKALSGSRSERSGPALRRQEGGCPAQGCRSTPRDEQRGEEETPL